ncbi:MAG: hypothetical protein JXD22_08610 [Sedimentisphaerales bacterium]|nr:hypothetical protein [Sedimentisphaerales bacterium]
MAVSYEEDTRNEKLVFVANDEDAMETFQFLYSKRIGVGIGYEDNIVHISPVENATEEQIQEIRDALS